jgi:uncharacterized membrane protein
MAKRTGQSKAQSKTLRNTESKTKSAASGKTATGDADSSAGTAHKLDPSRMNRLALWITERVGTMEFFLLIFAWTGSWLLWNTLGPRALRFDPFPGFVLWLFISNMIQLFLMPLIMIGQNLQGRGAENRARNDYKVNQKAEQEIQAIQAQLATILKRLDEVKTGIKPAQSSDNQD